MLFTVSRYFGIRFVTPTTTATHPDDKIRKQMHHKRKTEEGMGNKCFVDDVLKTVICR